MGGRKEKGKEKERMKQKQKGKEEERKKALTADRQEQAKRRLQGGDIKEIAYKVLREVQKF